MFLRFSGLFFRLAPIVLLAGANAVAGPVYNVSELHPDTSYSPARLNLAALFYADFRYDSDAPQVAAPPGEDDRLPPLGEEELAWAVDPCLDADSEEIFYSAGFEPEAAGYLYRTGDAGFTGETLPFTCNRAAGRFAITLCLSAGPPLPESSPDTGADFAFALYGQTEAPPSYVCAPEVAGPPAKIAASHADRSR